MPNATRQGLLLCIFQGVKAQLDEFWMGGGEGIYFGFDASGGCEDCFFLEVFQVSIGQTKTIEIALDG